MKKKVAQFLICVVSLVLAWGVGGISFADNAAEVVIQVSYPSDKDYVSYYNGTPSAIDDTKTNYYVNVHVTLLDADGDPATAGPGGEDLSTLTATLTTELGIANSMVEDEFLTDTATLNFDVTDVGPVARAHVRYACQTSCVPGADTLEVMVDSLTASAEVEVKGPDASSIVIRTLKSSGAGPVKLFDTISAPSHNAGIEAQAGTDIYFEVWAVEENGDFTFAPNLEGKEVTVSAYADYDADGTVETGEGTVWEGTVDNDALATATAQFSDGKATGKIQITKAGTKSDTTLTTNYVRADSLRVALTATTGVKNAADNKIETTQLKRTSEVGTGDIAETSDGSTDWVAVLPLTGSKLIIGSDPFGTRNIVEEVDAWYILDDEASGPTTNAMAVFVTDTYGNPVTGQTVTITSVISNSLLAKGVTDVTNGWNITTGIKDNPNDGLAARGGGADNASVPTGGGPIKGTLTLQDAIGPLTSDSATVYLARYDVDPSTTEGQNFDFIDLRLDIDKSNTVTAGETVTLYITSASGSADGPTTSEFVEYNDNLIIRAISGGLLPKPSISVAWDEGGNRRKLMKISGADGSFDTADTAYKLKAPVPESGTGEIRVPIKIYSECTRDGIDQVFVSLEVPDKGLQEVLINRSNDVMHKVFGSTRAISNLQPAGETKLKIKKLVSGVNASSSLDADPIIITSKMGVGKNALLSFDSVDTTDDYGNVYNDSPLYGINSEIGAAFVDETRGASVTYDADDVGQTDTITVSFTGVGNRQLQIVNIVKSAPATALVCTIEGPAVPTPGGEAIIKVKANDTTTVNKNVVVSIDTFNSAVDSELRDMFGESLGISTTKPLNAGDPDSEWVRLAVSAPEAGDVVFQASDTSGTNPLDSCSRTIHFVVDDEPPTASVDPCGGASVQPTSEIVITVMDNVGVALINTVYSVDKDGSDITNDLGCVKAGNETTEGTITCSKSEGLDLGTYTVSVTPADLAGNMGTEVTCSFTTSICTPTVVIEPDSASLLVGKTQQFSASTTCDGDSVDGTYTWEIMAGGCTGSAIGNTGLYTAPSSGDCTDTVKVTDTANDDATDTAQVTVTDCITILVSISPSSKTLKFEETQQFCASTTCDSTPLSGVYSWTIAGGTADTTSGDCIVYTAGTTAGTFDITVTDTTNDNKTATATVVVESPISCEVSPDPMIRSNLTWLPVVPFVAIAGDGTNFAAFSTTVSYSSATALILLPPLILGAELIWQGAIVNPAWLAGVTGDETVTATVTTGTEVVVCKDFEITLLDFLSLDYME